ncbi:hypothetical protein DSO57_1029110 [Entomophthora muscae]|nr:hypothetical protein DSO57_1029110 [Entomophthora muscae]
MHVINHYSLTRSLLGSDLGDGMLIRTIEETTSDKQQESQESFFHQVPARDSH